MMISNENTQGSKNLIDLSYKYMYSLSNMEINAEFSLSFCHCILSITYVLVTWCEPACNTDHFLN